MLGGRLVAGRGRYEKVSATARAHIFANRGGYFGESVGLDPETPLPRRDRCARLLLKGTLLFLRGLSAAEVLSSQAQAAAAARW